MLESFEGIRHITNIFINCYACKIKKIKKNLKFNKSNNLEFVKS